MTQSDIRCGYPPAASEWFTAVRHDYPAHLVPAPEATPPPQPELKVDAFHMRDSDYHGLRGKLTEAEHTRVFHAVMAERMEGVPQ